MKTFKYYFTADCISFTLVILINALLNALLNPDSLESALTLSELVQLFICTSLVELLMYFTDKLDIKTLSCSMIVGILDICAVMYIVGGLFKLISLRWQNVLIVFAVIIAVYFLTFAVMIFDDRNAAVLINKKLQKMNGDDTE